MKIILLIITIMNIQLNLIGQVIPEDKRVDWESAIQNINIKQPAIQLNVMDFGATGNGITNDQPAIMNAINNLSGQLGYIYFPSGEYLIEQPLEIPDSCILKGEVTNSTSLILNMGGDAVNCISFSKPQSAGYTNISDGLEKGSNLITVDNISSFSSGNYIEIRQKNGDWDVVPISWADYSVGQITKIVAINGNSLQIESPLRIDYSIELDPEVRPIEPLSNAGIQCMKIKRIDEPEDGAGANIFFNMAANCFVIGVESDKSVGAHVSINTSTNLLIEGSYFHHAFTYDGVGMRGYGVALSQHSGECLITNNIFKHLRHAMMIKTGSNGNVFSYNYSIEPFRSEPIHDAPGDVSFHGHYAFSNLWEGNIVQNIVIDHYWGPSGPFNTLFRNRSELYGIIMTTSELLETNKQNFVGNEVTNTTFLHGLYTITGGNHFEYGNNVKGVIIPSGTNNLNDNSYYLTSTPHFWSIFLPWPSVGFPNQLGDGTIPAKLRYNSSQENTICPDSVITTIDDNKTHHEIDIWPIPAGDKLNIQMQEIFSGLIEIQIISSFGAVVTSKEIEITNSESFTISTNGLKTGIYIVKLNTVNNTYIKKVIIAQ